MDTVRIDRFLWSIRVYKTRTEATDACKGNKVRSCGANAKPSKLIKIGDIIEVRKGSIQYIYKVKALLQNRVGAKLLPDYVENLTSEAELDKLRVPMETFFLKRDRGTGRPTKKDRRDMDSLMGEISYDSEIDDIPEDIAIRFGLDENE